MISGADTAGAHLLPVLARLGVSHVFVNSGTDFPPIIEGLAQAARTSTPLPQPVIVPHEHAAISMAHGHYLVSGQAQAVLLHTNVGLANAAAGAINAACDQVPMLILSGRTPVTEQGRFGARTVPIGWGQEMFDQHALIREACKWDYELRFPEQLGDLLARAWAIANATPKGPVYLSLPREVLSEPIAEPAISIPAPAVTAPAPEALREAATLLAGAERPLIIAQRGAGSTEAFAAMTDWCTEWALPLCHYFPNMLSLPIDHPMQVGPDPSPWLAEADVVLAVNALAPWMPDKTGPVTGAQTIQLGPDPLFQRTPVRHFPAEICLTGETGPTLCALIDAMRECSRDEPVIEARRARITAISAAGRAAAIAHAEAGNQAPMTKDWVSLCLGRAIQGREVRIFHELGCPLQPLGLGHHNSYFQEPYAGGLGWGLPAALGAQLAEPEHLIFATIGDGSYMFANPTACHFVAEAQGLPVITLVLNNGEWGAVRHAAEGLYPGGALAAANEVPFTSLEPSPDFTLTARASRAHAEKITNGEDLPATLARAIHIATSERRQVLLDIAIAK